MDDIESIKQILANLLVMQKVIGATLEGLVDVLLAKGIILNSEMKAINDDISEALGEDFAGR